MRKQASAPHAKTVVHAAWYGQARFPESDAASDTAHSFHADPPDTVDGYQDPASIGCQRISRAACGALGRAGEVYCRVSVAVMGSESCSFPEVSLVVPFVKERRMT